MASSRLVVAKCELSPDGPISGWVEPGQLHELQDWLAARFRRHALPDALMSRLSGSIKDLEGRLRNKGREIIGIWLGYEPREDLDVGEPYEVDLYVVFSVEMEGAESAAQDLIERLRRRLEDADGIVVGECVALSEQAFTLYDLRSTEQLRFEYISNRLGPGAPRVD